MYWATSFSVEELQLLTAHQTRTAVSDAHIDLVNVCPLPDKTDELLLNRTTTPSDTLPYLSLSKIWLAKDIQDTHLTAFKLPIFYPFSDLNFNPAEQPYMIKDLKEQTKYSLSEIYRTLLPHRSNKNRSDIADIIVLLLKNSGKMIFAQYGTIKLNWSYNG